MNRTRFSLADLLTLMAAVSFGFLLFLSFYFSTLGDLNQSILKASIFAIPLGILAYMLKLKKGVSRNFKSNIIVEGILVATFAVFAVLSIYPLSHYFAVSQQKEEIQSKIKSNITGLKGLFETYDAYVDKRISVYKSKLESIVKAKFIDPYKYREFEFGQKISDAEQIEIEVETMTANLKPQPYPSKEDSVDWIFNAENDVEIWSPIRVVNIVKDQSGKPELWTEKLKKYSAWRNKEEETIDFNYPISFNQVSSFFTKETPLHPLGIGIHLGLIFLMLFSYLISKRHERIRGNVFKLLFGDSTTDDKEL